MSAITPINAATSGAASSSASTVAKPSQTLNQNDFLKLLVAQMQYQDPMNPQSDTQMAAQMAQFTSLQQTSQMSSSLSMLQANNLVGSTVTVQVTPGSTNVTSGMVTGVDMSSGSPQIVVTDPKTGLPTSYNLSQVLSLTPMSATPAATGTTTTPPTTPPAAAASGN